MTNWKFQRKVTTMKDGIYSEVQDTESELLDVIVAGGFPVAPPDEWFEDPKLTGPTPLTVEASGRVFGHIATFDVAHIGMPGKVHAPKSRSGYAFFKTGEIITAGGQRVAVGNLTLAGGHAPLQADAGQAVEHYDNTASAIADINVGEDRYGIWAAGSLRPEATAEQIRALRASAPSGDWRPINGNLELVAICQVNVPGFPVARARVASGAVMALVAAGARPLAEQRFASLADEALASKVTKLEAALIASGLLKEAEAETEVVEEEEEEQGAPLSDILEPEDAEETAPVDTTEAPDRFQKLREEIRARKQAQRDALRDRVHRAKETVAASGEAEASPKAEALSGREALRARVHGGQEPVTAGVLSKWKEWLHPRGMDGRFIEKASWVDVAGADGGGGFTRGRVTAITEDHMSVDYYTPDGKKTSKSENIQTADISKRVRKSAEPKARLTVNDDGDDSGAPDAAQSENRAGMLAKLADTLPSLLQDPSNPELRNQINDTLESLYGKAWRDARDSGEMPGQAVDPRAVELANDMISRYTTIEPNVTTLMESFAAQNGFEMFGLEHRLKKADSLSRKINNDSIEKGLSHDDAAADIKDALRYTMLMDGDESFVSSYRKVLDGFAADGWSMVRNKDTMQTREAVYRGVNVIMQSPSGEMVELQFHTKDSMAVKNLNHVDYEVARLLDTPSEAKAALDWRMRDRSASLPVPPEYGTAPVA